MAKIDFADKSLRNRFLRQQIRKVPIARRAKKSNSNKLEQILNSEKSLLTYLRHSRCDADQMGNKDSEIVASNEAPFSELLLGKINEKFAECFFSNHFKKNISDRRSEENFFENEDPENYDKRRISFFIAPVVFAPKKEHGEYRSDKKRFLIPVLFKAFLDSTGQLTPHSEPKAWIPREHLLPAFDSENFCIGTLDDQDKFTTNQSICEHSGSWSQVFVSDIINPTLFAEALRL